MKNVIENLFGFLYTLSMGDYFFFIATFILILAFVYVIYLIKSTDYKDEKNEEINYIENIKNDLENNYKPEYSDLTDYEKEQEESAIISYEELIKNKDKMNYSYDDEYVSDVKDIEVKKINLSSKGFDKVDEKIEVKLFDYKEEEEFLMALKQLQNNLINVKNN